MLKLFYLENCPYCKKAFQYIEKHNKQYNVQIELIEERKQYNSETLGDIIFGIYKLNFDGTEQLITYTNQFAYTYVGNENTTIIIRAEHSNFKTNASSGIKSGCERII